MSTASPPAFRTIPLQEELSEVNRDLRFYACGVPEPSTLDREQIEAFNREGYLKGLRVFAPGEMVELRTYFDGLLAEALAAGRDSYSISTAHLKHGRVYDLLTHPGIVGLVADLLGPNVVGWGSHFFCKMPGDGKVVHWHQDASYWPLDRARTVTVWLAVDDADVENACMRYIPGSHHHGHLTYRLTEDNPDAVLNQEVENVDQFGDPIYVQLRAGEVSLHSDLLLHASDANRSARRRCGLTLRYCAAEVRAGLDWNLKGVVVAGEDPSGHWANPPRPAGD